MPQKLIIAIDGPAGAGKSTVAKMLAEKLGYIYIDSGAMYRAVALLALETGTPLDDASALAKLAASANIRFERRDSENRLLLHSRDITTEIRSPDVTKAASLVSVHADVRKELVAQQRALGGEGGVVMEGRDIGTKVFPHADIKIFLDASPQARGQRRLHDEKTPAPGTPEDVLGELEERDRRDRERQESPLVPAADAITIDSTQLTAEDVVEKVLNLVRQKQQISNTLKG